MTTQSRAGALLANVNESSDNTFGKIVSELSIAIFDGTADLDEKVVADMLGATGRELHAGFDGLSDFVGNVADALDTIEYGTRRVSTAEVDNLDKVKKLLKETIKQLGEFNDELKKSKDQVDF
jgi:uncharacterized protein YdcH (DUF465 family)